MPGKPGSKFDRPQQFSIVQKIYSKPRAAITQPEGATAARRTRARSTSSRAGGERTQDKERAIAQSLMAESQSGQKINFAVYLSSPHDACE